MGRVARTPLAAVGILTPAPRSAATTAHAESDAARSGNCPVELEFLGGQTLTGDVHCVAPGSRKPGCLRRGGAPRGDGLMVRHGPPWQMTTAGKPAGAGPRGGVAARRQGAGLSGTAGRFCARLPAGRDGRGRTGGRW